jgi:serine-type D-Ala-D-Ala carboxypeptidase/endopeptidase
MIFSASVPAPNRFPEHRGIRAALVALWVLIHGGALASMAIAQVDVLKTSDEENSELTLLIDQHVTTLVAGPTRLRGLVVGVVCGNDRQVSGYGKMGRSPESPDGETLFKIASATKPLSALLLAQLVVEKRLGYDDVAISFGENPVTYRQLVTHTSGLPQLAPKLKDSSLEGFRGFLADFTLPRWPGSRFEYSTMGYGVLGFTLAEHGGSESFESCLTTRILAPLGMARTFFELPESSVSRYAGETLPPARHGANPFNASGGLISSANDLLRFVAANLRPDSCPGLAHALRLTQQICPEIKQTFPGSGAALGWLTFGATGKLFYFTGVAQGFRTFITFDVDAGCGVVMLTNTDLPPHEPRLEISGFALLHGLTNMISSAAPSREVPADSRPKS